MKTAAVAAALLALVGSAFLRYTLEKMPDFEVYWRAGHRVVAAEPLYRDEDGHFRHKYWPVFALLVSPLAALPLDAAKVVWFYLSIVAVAGLIVLALRLLPNRKPPPWLLAAVTFAAMAKFYAHEVTLGQCNTFMVLATLGGAGFLIHDEPVLAGLAFAFATAIKPYPLAFIPYLFLTRRLTTLVVFIAATIVALAVPAAIYGATGNAGLLAEWVRTISQSTGPNLLNQDNVSIWAMYAKWMGTGHTAVLFATVTVACLAIAFTLLVRAGRDLPRREYLDCAMLLALIPLVSPQGWDYGLLSATPAVMLFLNAWTELPVGLRALGAAAIIVMGGAVFDLLGRTAYASFMSISSITLCALALLTSTAFVRLRRLA